MKTKFALLLVFCAISLNIFAQEKKIKDRRTNPELYYLEESEVANSLELLPPPPEVLVGQNNLVGRKSPVYA